MNQQKIDDHKISSLVQSVKYKIPEAVEDKINSAIEESKTIKSRSRFFKKPLLWYPVSLTAALLIILTLSILINPLIEKKPALQKPPISEIRTQFEIKEKNIKILWIQKKDFQLNTGG